MKEAGTTISSSTVVLIRISWQGMRELIEIVLGVNYSPGTVAMGIRDVLKGRSGGDACPATVVVTC